MTHYYLTTKSRNAKTGPIPVSTTSADTCPNDCPFRGNGCYADGYPLKGRWDEVTRGERGGNLAAFCEQVAALPDGQLWRHNQAGDLPGDGEEINAAELMEIVIANMGRRGFTFTHYNPAKRPNAVPIEIANREGFTINLSANSLAHADQLAALDIGPVASVLPLQYQRRRTRAGWTETLVEYKARLATLPQLTPAGRRAVVCPATYRDDVTCTTCRLCAERDRKVIVGFPAHGTHKSKADAVAA
jgi:hypothetical protein